ncbi:hypothetical protein [Telluribacter sp. SYSU D00476]|uniref:hypothetical protein n=1 Tax=Telluribacter sp. SYSU D00476 TaxID=2811430 RepID=UPI001FF24299|nr:hypothetical protein [Telluribacter sp. SYSU D00476]
MQSSTDLYPVYKRVIPVQRHHQKAGGTSASATRNTLRQRQPHLTPNTLAFAKTDDSHFARVLNFINYYNKSRSP